MRFLGIDYGEKRVGIAMSDDGGTIAFPKEIIINDDSLIDSICNIILEEKIEEVVVGESVDYKGTPNKIEEEVNNFIAILKDKTKIPINRQKEFFTSVEARKGVELKSLNNKIDDSAAALILQRYLDKVNNHRHGGTSKNI